MRGPNKISRALKERFAQQVLENTKDGLELLEIALDLARSTEIAPRDRLAAVSFLADRAFGRAPMSIEITTQEGAKDAIETALSDDEIAEALSTEELREYVKLRNKVKSLKVIEAPSR